MRGGLDHGVGESVGGWGQPYVPWRMQVSLKSDQVDPLAMYMYHPPHAERSCAWTDLLLWILEILHHSSSLALDSMPVTRSQSVTASERAESEHPETTPIKWSKHHQSPKAEVILVSSDNVSFRVDAWYLKQKRCVVQWIMWVRLMISGFIKDLLDLPSHQSIETAPIQLDQVSRHVELFVDLVVSSGQALMYIALDDCKPLLDLCDHLQAPAIDKRVWQALTSRLWNTTLFKNLSP